MIFGWDVIKHALKLLESVGNQTSKSGTIVVVKSINFHFLKVCGFCFTFRGLRQLLQRLVP